MTTNMSRHMGLGQEEAYGLRPVSFVSVGLLGGLTCLLF